MKFIVKMENLLTRILLVDDKLCGNVTDEKKHIETNFENGKYIESFWNRDILYIIFLILSLMRVEGLIIW